METTARPVNIFDKTPADVVALGTTVTAMGLGADDMVADDFTGWARVVHARRNRARQTVLIRWEFATGRTEITEYAAAEEFTLLPVGAVKAARCQHCDRIARYLFTGVGAFCESHRGLARF